MLGTDFCHEDILEIPEINYRYSRKGTTSGNGFSWLVTCDMDI